MGKILIVNAGPVGELSADAVAQAVAERLSEYKVAAVYFCPLPDSIEMARFIAGRLGLQAQPLPGLGEVQHVCWKGLVQKENSAADFSNGGAPPGAGSMIYPDAGIDELREASAVALDEIAVKHKKETAVIVSQRVMSVIMILHLLHLDSKHYDQIDQQPGAMNLFEYRFGVPSALYINDTCHLHNL